MRVSKVARDVVTVTGSKVKRGGKVTRGGKGARVGKATRVGLAMRLARWQEAAVM